MKNCSIIVEYNDTEILKETKMQKELILPNVKIELPCFGDVSLMLLGGRKPSVKWLSALVFYKELLAVDRGLDSCLACGRFPDKLIGDGDSADSMLWEEAVKSGVPIYKFQREKDATDFQLALDIFSRECTGKSLFLSGAFGGRFDHLWSVIISFLNRSNKYQPLGMADEKEGMIFLKDEAETTISFEKKPLAISLISFSNKCEGVSIDGVKWPLTNVLLEYANPYSISNEVFDSGTVSVKIKKGLLGVYWVQNEQTDEM